MEWAARIGQNDIRSADLARLMVVANVKMHEQAVKREQEVVLRNVNPVVE